MSALRRIFAATFVAASLCVAGCAGDAGARSAGTSPASSADEAPSSQSAPAGEPVHGDVSVTWKNLDPKYPVARASLVNESSATGKLLRSGTKSSSEIRVMSDADMGVLLATLKEFGFFTYATDGLDLGNVPDVPGKKGIIVVTQDGRSKGLMLTLNMGASPIPKTYVNSKDLVLGVHSQLQGADFRVGVGPADENTFQAPPVKMKRP